MDAERYNDYMVRAVSGFILVVLLVPLLAFSDVLDRPFFAGALGRAAYSAPVEYVRPTKWDNQLRFSFPEGFRIERVVANGLAQLGDVTKGVAAEAEDVAIAFLTVTSRELVRVATSIQLPQPPLAAYTAAAAARDTEPAQKQILEPRVYYVEQAPTLNVSRCSRAISLAQYTWCRMGTQSVF